jgi:Uma2 family endonuclease
MSLVAKRRATYEDVLGYPEGTHVELVDGELQVSPRPSTPHVAGSSTLAMLLGTPFHLGRGGPGGWVILYEPELHLGPDVVIPDLAAWRRERMPEIPREPAIDLAPDWVCEFLSHESTAAYDRKVKVPLYAANGVRHLWIADDQDRTLEDYRLTPGGWLLVKTFSGEEQIRAEPFEAVELELGWLWRR